MIQDKAAVSGQHRFQRAKYLRQLFELERELSTWAAEYERSSKEHRADILEEVCSHLSDAIAAFDDWDELE